MPRHMTITHVTLILYRDKALQKDEYQIGEKMYCLVNQLVRPKKRLRVAGSRRSDNSPDLFSVPGAAATPSSRHTPSFERTGSWMEHILASNSNTED